jgi:hypothetical protein
MTRIAMTVCCTIALAGCAGTPEAPDVMRGDAVAIAPYAIHEACAKLGPGDRLEYRYTSHEPVSFNIHYHEGAAVVTPIQREQSREDAGIYAPTLEQGYCLMWEAGAAGTTLAYEARVRRGAR